MITIEDLLSDLDRACLAHLVSPGPGSASDAAIVVRRLARYLDELAGEGLGTGPRGRERQRVTEQVAAAASRTVRALDLPMERGRVGDLAGIAVDALRTSRPPMDPSERWAIAVRLQQSMSTAAAILTCDTDSPEPVLLHHTARGVRQYGDLDRPTTTTPCAWTT